MANWDVRRTRRLGGGHQRTIGPTSALNKLESFENLPPSMNCRIAVITDIHYSRSAPVLATRQGQWGAVLLRRTVERLNRWIKPDVAVVLGDLLDDPREAELLRELRTILETLTCPWLALPGNHDPAPAVFYETFPRIEHLEVAGVRLVGLVDEERPQWNACRTAAGFEQMAQAAVGHAGPLVALQHVPVGEPGCETPYGYTNYAAVADAMRRYGYRLALSGHDHKGRALQPSDGFSTMTVPALCEAPFSFAVVSVAGDTIEAEVFHQEWPALTDADAVGHLPE
jgi:predicted phosphodiesterase